MATIKFPANPSDGMVFEPTPGLYYQYNAKEKSWVRIDGIRLGLATPLVAGLMSADDLKKLNSLIIPPPQSTLKGEDCDIEFKSGTIALYSSDGSIIAEPSLENIGPNVNQVIPWALHENTAGYNFKLNYDQFVQEIEKRGNIRRTLSSGPDGYKGYKGQPGIDKLDTGPEGPQGENGTNAPFSGVFIPEVVQFKIIDEQDGRAIVNLEIEDADDGHYLVATRANIGNPGICTTSIKPSQFTSPWLLVIDKQPNQIVNRVINAVNTSSGDECQLTCQICVSSLYYLNIEPILDAIATRYNNKLLKLKSNTEQLAQKWLKTMVSMFNEQKYALCCALENCESRKRNSDTKNRIEDARIQAAQAKRSLVINSSEDDFQFVPSETSGSCDVPDGPIETDSHVVYGTECEEYLVTISLDAKLHNIDPRTGIRHRSLSARLPAGDYVLEVKDCCANMNHVKLYTPKASIPTESPTTPTPPTNNDNPPITINAAPYVGPALVEGNGPVGSDAVKYNPGKEYADANPPITLYAKPTGGLAGAVSNYALNGGSGSTVLYSKLGGGKVPPGLRVPFDSVDGNENRGAELPASGLQPNSLYGPGRFTGRIAMLYRQNIPALLTDGEDKVIQSVLEVPNLGEFEDISMARHAYIGHSVGFSHSGGNITLWIPDPDRLASNNDGSIVVGIRSKKCYDTTSSNPTNVTEDTVPTLYVYREDLSPDNLITSIVPFEAPTATHIMNYGYDGNSANLGVGPELYKAYSKLFFVKTSDGLGFYLINSKFGSGIATPITVKSMVEGNSIPVTPVVSDDPGDVTYADLPQGRMFTSTWAVNNDTEGMVLNGFDEEQTSDWIITLDNMSFGDISKLIAASADGTNTILAGGSRTDPIPDQGENTAYKLCRALIRSCNVIDGFGGRYSLGVINREKGKNFRICKVINTCDFEWIRKPYIYAPYPEPCGANACDVKFEVISGTDGQVRQINRIPLQTGQASTENLDVMFVLDTSGSMTDEIEFVKDILIDFINSIKTETGFTQVRVGLVSYGQYADGIKAPGESRSKSGDPIMQNDLTTDYDSVISALNGLTAGGDNEPGYWAVQYTAENASWTEDALKCVILITDENNDTRKGITKGSVDNALSNKNILFNAIVSAEGIGSSSSVINTYGVPVDTKNYTYGGTGLGYEHNGTLFNLESLRSERTRSRHYLLDPVPTAQLGDEESVSFHRLSNFRVESLAEVPGACPRVKMACDLEIDDAAGDFDFNDLIVRMHFENIVPCLQTGAITGTTISKSITYSDGLELDIDLASTEEKTTLLTNTGLCTGDQTLPFIQPFAQLRLGSGASTLGYDYNDNGDRIAVPVGSAIPLIYNPANVAGYGFKVISGTVKDGHIPFVGAIVNFKTSATGTKVMGTCITDSNGTYVFRIPEWFIAEYGNFTITIETILYPFNSTTTSAWTLDTPTKEADWAQLLKLSGGGLSDYGTETTWTPNGNVTITVTDGSVLSIRGVVHRGGYDSDNGFYSRFKALKIAEFKAVAPPISVDCSQNVNGGPSIIYKTVEGIPMTEETLNGRILGITATTLAAPGTCIRPLIFDKFGRGIAIKSIYTSESPIWETHSWLMSNIEQYYTTDNSTNFDILLKDAVSMSFEFINPGVGNICYFGEVKAIVERYNSSGDKEVVLVDIATFEPFGTSVSEPGEIPLVLYSGTVTEEDTSAYLENFWVIASSEINSPSDACVRYKAYCPECEVTLVNAQGVDGTVTTVETNCSGNDVNILVPLTKYLITPIGPGESCLMHYKQVEWYERGWRVGACCGAKITIDGVTWIVVKRSIGTDTSCGGGESTTTKCIQQFVDSGEGHPAIAWPTIDGEEFSGRPTTGYARFVKDTGLSDAIKIAIARSEHDELRGNLETSNVIDTIPFILFPVM